MKKRVYCLLVFPILLLSSSLVSCNKGRSFYYMNGDQLESFKVEVYYSNEYPNVPLLDLETAYKNDIFLVDDNYSCSLGDNNVYTVTNKKNNSTMTFDANNLTVTYSEYAKFFTKASINNGLYLDEISNNNYRSKIIDSKSQVIKGDSKVFDLKKYNFPSLKKDNKIYLPLDVLYNIACLNSYSYYNCSNGIYILDGEDGIRAEANKYLRNFDSKDYEYSYNLFSFILDLKYGLNSESREMRSDENKVKIFNKDGALETLKDYKDKIINSKDIVEFDGYIQDAINNNFDDGGHTYYKGTSLGDTTLQKIFGKEINKLFDIDKEIEEYRKGKEELDQNISSYDTDGDGKKDIGYVYLKSFVDSTYVDKKGEKKVSTMDVICGTNENLGANDLFNKNSPKYDKNKYDIKDIVIDMSLNRGGSTVASGFLQAWFSGGETTETLRSKFDNYAYKVTCQYDVNNDGVYDNKDYLPDDVNIYLLIGPTCFSAGNSAVFNPYCSKEEIRTKKNLKFIGKNPYGGSCSITDFLLPTGSTIQISSSSLGVNYKDKTINAENYVKVDEGWNFDLENIYNREFINNEIVNARSK